MGRIRVDCADLDDLTKALDKAAAQIGDIADDCLDAAAPTLQNALKTHIEIAADRGYATGALAGSIEPTKARENAYGHFVAVRPTGSDSKGRRNGEIMAYLQYGTPRTAGHDVIGRAVATAEAQCTEIIKKRFEEHIKSLGFE